MWVITNATVIISAVERRMMTICALEEQTVSENARSVVLFSVGIATLRSGVPISNLLGAT